MIGNTGRRAPAGSADQPGPDDPIRGSVENPARAPVHPAPVDIAIDLLDEEMAGDRPPGRMPAG